VLYRRHAECVTLSHKLHEERRLVVQRLLALLPENERAGAGSYLAGQDAAEAAFLAVGQRCFGSAVAHLARAFSIAPAAACDVVAARAACLVSRWTGRGQ
jgi:hypothetical protein